MTDSANLWLPLGRPGSGRLRYAAAMSLHARGQMSEAALEVYRICSPLDGEDPAPLLASLGLQAPRAPVATPVAALRALIDAADGYLATLPGPGAVELRAGIAQHLQGFTFRPAADAPLVTTHLPTALAALATTHATLADALRIAQPHLRWTRYDAYDPAEIGEGFADNHAFAPLIGDGAPFPARNFDFGLFLVAPHVLYRDHAHAAPELYAPLTGPHGWRFGPDRPLVIKAAHSPVWNRAHQPHLTKVGPTPFLALYGWLRDTDAPAYVLPARDWQALEALRLPPS